MKFLLAFSFSAALAFAYSMTASADQAGDYCRHFCDVGYSQCVKGGGSAAACAQAVQSCKARCPL